MERLIERTSLTLSEMRPVLTSRVLTLTMLSLQDMI